MEEFDPGHVYKPDVLDIPDEADDDWKVYHEGVDQLLIFVKREGEDYPGNVGSYPGTTVQEVCRILIARLKYVDNQKPDGRNGACIVDLRRIIARLEYRAAERHGLPPPDMFAIHGYKGVEDIPTCRHCGHITCKEFQKKENCI